MKQRIYLWDNLKFVMMMLVIMTHSACIYLVDAPSWLRYAWAVFFVYKMPVFAIVSGFWFKAKPTGVCAKRYLIPMAIFGVLNISLAFISGFAPLSEWWNVLQTGGYAMWYLFSLFVWTLVTPYLMRHGVLVTLLSSVCLAFVAGISGFPHLLMRTISFYPFFVLGIFLKDCEVSIYRSDLNKKIIALFVFFIGVAMLVALETVSNGYCLLATGLEGAHGLSLVGMVKRWIAYALNGMLSIATIMLMPNRRFSFTSLGSRTLNAYLLHMAVIFPLCWGLGRLIMWNWYGFVWNLVGVPILSLALFSAPVDQFLKRIKVC